MKTTNGKILYEQKRETVNFRESCDVSQFIIVSNKTFFS